MSDEIANASLKTPRKPEQPILWIIAGPNGSGKSSLYNRTDIEGWGGSVWIINPDLLTSRLVEAEALSLAGANKVALDRIYAWLEASIDVHQTIGVETVLSSPKYRNLLATAKGRGFHIRMIYVVLRSADLQLERIRIRVSEGGHDVPAKKVVARRTRSFEQLAWFFGRVDECFIYDNSTGEPELIGGKKADCLVQIRPFPSDMEGTLRNAGVEMPRLINPASWKLL
jgi:predicted ABC-type ATPase